LIVWCWEELTVVCFCALGYSLSSNSITKQGLAALMSWLLSDRTLIDLK
jgi:hypothetical protein